MAAGAHSSSKFRLSSALGTYAGDLMGENPDSPLSDWNNDRIEESRGNMLGVQS